MMRRLSVALALAFVAGCTPPGSAPTTGGATPTPPPAPAASPTPAGLTFSGTPDQIAAQIEAAIAKEPKNAAYRLQAAQFYMNGGAYPQAIVHLQAATKLTKDALPWIALGDALMLTRQFGPAQRAYDEVAKREPDSERYFHGQAQLWVAQEQFKKAGQMLERAVEKYPDSVDLRAALGNLYLVVNKPKRAVDTLEPAVKKVPERADLLLLLGDAHERNLHLNAAIEALRAAVRYEPRMSEAWGKLGQNLVNVTRYAEAREPLLKAITLEPTNSYYYWALGDSFVLDTTDPANQEKGLKLYDQALNLDPKNPKALYSYAMALTRRGQPGDAARAAQLFERMLALKSTDMNVRYKLYEIYKGLGKTAEANRHLAAYKDLFAKGQRQTRQLYNEASFLDTAESHVDLAKRALEKGNLTLAAREYDLALEREPGLAAAKAGKADVEKRLGERKGAKP